MSHDQRFASLFALSCLLAAPGCGPSSTHGNVNLPDLGADGSASRLDMAVNVINQDAGGIAPPDLHFDNDAFWADNPPPMTCTLDGGMAPKAPGGTPECPDDKNREGCDCPVEGMSAACWPGPRANRHLGICTDGKTTCMKAGELGLRWGPCMDYQLPLVGYTTGSKACKCFSAGQWKLDNLSPCFADSGGGYGSGGVTSSYYDPNTKMTTCPMGGMLPAMPWSTDTLRADCAGHFRLCYALKAGDAKKPNANDCTIVEVCVDGDYSQVNAEQPLPPLPAFFANSPAAEACAVKFTTSGGYGEMRVDGTTVTCDKVQKVFNRVSYCPLSCNKTPNDPMCAQCGAGGGGNF